MTDRQHPRGGRDPYATLGVGADASEEEITRAFRRLARAQHPDTNPEAADGDFVGLTDAYDVLRDPGRRRRYDQTRDMRRAAARAATTRIPVHTVRPDRRTAAPDGRNPTTRAAEVDLELTFDQAVLGTTATVSLPGRETCPACAGRGVSPAPSPCPACGGVGASTRRSSGIAIRTNCPSCQGTGKSRPASCDACNGRGTTTTHREHTVHVPAGVEHGSRLLLDSPDGSTPVEAVVHVAAHPFLGRRGNHVTIRLPVTLAEAALGAVITVPTLDDAVTIRIPAGTPHGRVLRIAGRGIADSTRPGDLLVTVAIDIPTALNDRQRAALEAYGDATASPRSHLEGRALHPDSRHEDPGGAP